MTAVDGVTSSGAVRLRMLVVVDPKTRGRGEFWTEEARLYNESPFAAAYGPVSCEPVALAEDVSQTPTKSTEFLLNRMERTQVLILNWDVANGDPMYGADVVSRWFEHYQWNVRDWVKRGGILVIEGQANRAIPHQGAYDKILGELELRVCGPESRVDAGAQLARVGSECQLTRAARGSDLFNAFRYRSLTGTDRTWEDYFPSAPKSAIDPDLKAGPGPILWRGWFRKRLVNRSRLTWVPVFKTAGRRPTNQTTMLVAVHGRGAILATTMYLALSAREPRLLNLFVSCYGHADRLPKRQGVIRLLTAYESYVLVVFAAVLMFVVWPRIFSPPPAWFLYTSTALLALVLGFVRGLWRRAANLVRDLLGI